MRLEEVENMVAGEILVESEALLTGHFLLTSGRHAGQYVQCAKVLQEPVYANALAKIIAKGFENVEVELVIAPAMGGILIGYELARVLGAKSIFTEREDGIMTLRRGFEIPKGTKVVIAEDVVTTGNSAREVLKIANEHGANVLGVASIVDRTGGAVDFGVKFVSAFSKKIISYTQDECPLCKDGIKVVKPGSRVFK
ncbi:MAG: orotate phosphoribosyltransferase [Defluviitaleaceae bacterium]|nr:orotate phosphoribosyltransferase [Defluviitaleaceae bacterium]